MPFEFDFDSISVMDLKTVMPAVFEDRIFPAAPLLARYVKSWDFPSDPHQEESYYNLTWMEDWPKFKEAFGAAWKQWQPALPGKPYKGDLKKITMKQYQAIQSISFWDPSPDYIEKVAAVMALAGHTLGQEALWAMPYKTFAETHKGMIEALTKRADVLGE